MSEPRRAIIAAEDDEGHVLYEFGWVDTITWQTDSEHGPPVYASTVRWLGPPQRQTRYPTEQDFAAALPTHRRLPAPPTDDGPPFAPELVAASPPHLDPALPDRPED